jgi:predicted RNase H-like nuclease (RuvC/YqgF family)
MKKTKNLKKRIRRLEARLQKGAKKLAKLKRKLETAETTAGAEGQSKVAASVKGPSAPRKVKRKLNLTPERRAQLAAAMKARWAARRAAAATNVQSAASSPQFSTGDTSQPQ